MKLPRKPPDYRTCISELLASDKWPEIFRQGLFSPTTQNGRYVHWDKLKYYPSIDGVTKEQWWAALKLARSATLKPLPLLDKAGQPFYIGSPDQLQRQTSEIDRDLSGRLSIPEELRNSGTRDRYLFAAMIEEAITSSQLEGAVTTSRVAREMLRSQRQPRTVDERMIYNNYQAMQYVLEHQEDVLTPGLVLKIHAIVADKTLDEECCGRLRSSDDIVVKDPDGQILHVPPPAAELEARMQHMCAFANGETPGDYIHPVVRATLLHFWLAYDHPFEDGNGRTARALFYWSMLHAKYRLCQFVSISPIVKKAPSKYARAYLYTETDDNDTTYFALYQLDVIQRGIVALHEYILEKSKAIEKTERLIRKSQNFNHRQLALLSHALANPSATYTVRSHATSHHVTRQTARTDLNVLVDHGFLESSSLGRGKAYRPPRDLESRLGDLDTNAV
jgi:Fic family protein